MKILIRENLQTKEINIYGTDGKLHIEEFFEKYFSDTGGASNDVFNEFENIYCGIEEEKTGLRVFIVKSAKSRKVFYKIRVIKED